MQILGFLWPFLLLLVRVQFGSLSSFCDATLLGEWEGSILVEPVGVTLLWAWGTVVSSASQGTDQPLIHSSTLPGGICVLPPGFSYWRQVEDQLPVQLQLRMGVGGKGWLDQARYCQDHLLFCWATHFLVLCKHPRSGWSSEFTGVSTLPSFQHSVWDTEKTQTQGADMMLFFGPDAQGSLPTLVHLPESPCAPWCYSCKRQDTGGTELSHCG